MSRVFEEAGAAARGRRRAYRVKGLSMAPTLSEGDWVWVTTGPRRLPSVGALVVVRHPKNDAQLMIKRVRSLGERSFAVGSDDPMAGTDSRHFGSLRVGDLVGCVTHVWSRGAGVRRVRRD